ncbi:MAG: DUF2240 family protein [Candidatus Aenigmarchaeota archaeon]|nr:DUF2240 family protein [Candidatus Aenigmarchaeota archaeon]
MLSLEELIMEISKKSEYSEDEIKKMIEEKQDELSGLVSEEGAAYIIARELGLTLLEEQARNLKARDVVPGMFSVDLNCKIAKITDIRTFERNGTQGTVQNVLLGDETGIIRLSIWNDEIERFHEFCIKEGDTVKITKMLSKEDNLGNAELRLGKRGKIEKIKDLGINLPVSARAVSFSTAVQEKTINNLKAGDRVRIKGRIIQIFKRKPYYEVCEKCEGKVEKMNDKWLCKSCGETNPKFALLLSGIIDDGYGNIRTIMFKENAERVLGKTGDDIKKLIEKSKDPLTIYDSSDVLGKHLSLRGSVKENDFSGNIEFIANEVEEIDSEIRSHEMIGEIEKINKIM